MGVEELDKEGHTYGEQLPELRGGLKLHGGVVGEDGLHHRRQAIELHRQTPRKSNPCRQIEYHPVTQTLTQGVDQIGARKSEPGRQGGRAAPNLLAERGGVAFTATSDTGCDGEGEEATGSSAAIPLAVRI